MAKFVVPDCGGAIARYVAERTNQPTPGLGTYQAIGLVDEDSRILGGVIVCDTNECNAALHVAGEPGWINRTFLRFLFHYLFVQLGLVRVTGMVAASNAVALEFDRRIGFKDEFVMKDGAPDGDLIVLCMRREDCRWI
jgi:RimJ/RimL family protein N-acetyltransferase